MWAHELKLQRALEHLKKLEAEVRRWSEGEGYSLIVETDGHPTSYVAYAELLEPIGEDPWSLLIGDFLQNARSALDYLAIALGDVGAGGVMSDDDAARTMFPMIGGTDPLEPIRGGHRRFVRRAKKRLPTLTKAMWAAIEDFQPYKTGGKHWAAEPLWVLNELARFDRHRLLQLAVIRAGGFRLNPVTSENVKITDMWVEEGSYSVLEAVAAEEAYVDRLEGFEGNEHRTRLARFFAEPIDPSKEMKMDFEGALEIEFDADRLPPLIRIWGLDEITGVLGLIPPEIEKVFEAASPFLPAEPPEW